MRGDWTGMKLRELGKQVKNFLRTANTGLKAYGGASRTKKRKQRKGRK